MTVGDAPHAEPSPVLEPAKSVLEPAKSVLEPAEADFCPSDRDLLAPHVAGDATAFAALVTRHQDRMWAIALQVMRNPDDAADALQDAYVAAFRRAGSFRGDAQVTTWLHRVVVNACLDRLRKIKRRSALQLPDDLDRSDLLAVGSPEGAADRLAADHDRSVVAGALDQINPDQRAALVLVDMQGYSIDEAAQILGCAPGTVKSRCARGRAKLLPLLAALRQPEGG